MGSFHVEPERCRGGVLLGRRGWVFVHGAESARCEIIYGFARPTVWPPRDGSQLEANKQNNKQEGLLQQTEVAANSSQRLSHTKSG